MKPTDISVPDYFHKVVDCQWACPAHTPVPEYIRLIAAGRYGDAYMVNWHSNVFPGILGRTCDRPCEPACRRVRVEKEPVAICRLKRVAADFKDDIRDRLPKAPSQKNGKRIALIGGGPASLTVARDLAPMGYDCVVFDQDPQSGGMMRTQIPKFRLPETVLDEECQYILDIGIEFVGGKRIDSLKALLAENYDAIFVGCGAPRGRNLEIPGRKEAAKNIHIGIDWLSSVSFGHIDRIGKRVIVLGGGNTAMDCCRSSRRLGGEDVKVIVRSGFEEMKASPWEKEDAMHEDIPIFNYLVPKEFTHDNGKLTGVTFEKVKAVRDAKGRRELVPTGEPDQHFPCDDVLVAVGQENAFPWIERDCGIEFDTWDMPKVDTRTMASTHPKVFFGGDAAFGPKNIIWAVAHGHEAAISIDRLCRGEDINVRPPPQLAVSSQKMGIHEWSYDNEITLDKRYRVPHRDKVISLRDIKTEVELGYDPDLALKEAERCLNCDVQTLYGKRRGSRAAGPAAGAGEESHPGSLYRQQPQNRPRHGEGRGRLPALRPVRGALSHRRVGHAEIPDRYDSRRTSMPIQSVNDFVVRFANVNGSGSASANELFARAVLRMGVPVAPRNIFPSNIQGLPTWYEVRISQAGYLGARGGTDLMVAMNPQTWDKDVAGIEPGGYLLYDSTKPMPKTKFRDDITVIGVPLTAICNREYSDPRQRQLFKNIIYVGALSALLDMDVGEIEKLIAEQYKGKEMLFDANKHALHLGRDWVMMNMEHPIGLRLQRANGVGNRIFIEGNSAAALGAVYGGATVCAWYPITPSSSLAEAFTRHCSRLRVDGGSKQNKYAIVQAEDELASIGIVIGASWNGARAFTATSGPGISLMQEFLGLAYFAEIPAVVFDVQRAGPSTGMPTRTQQTDIISCAYASHGDTKHVLLFPEDPTETFDFAATAFDLADRLQTPVFVMIDLDIGMNHRLARPLAWDDSRKYDRGKVMTAAALEAGKDFGRYLDVDGDGIPYRTYPGTHPTKGSFFTRGTSRDRYARYTEEGPAYADNMQRLLRKFDTAKDLVPRPLQANADKPTKYGVIYFGSTSPAMDEAIEMLEAKGQYLDRLRVRAFPFHSSVTSFIAEHDFIFVVEQNRDAQLRSLIVNECGIDPVRLVPILHYDGTPITARFIARAIGDHLDALKITPLRKVVS